MGVMNYYGYPGMIIKIEQYAATCTLGSMAAEYMWRTKQYQLDSS
jgi:hypothetical protein